MSGYDSDESMGHAPLTPGLSESHSMQVSRSSSPERFPIRRRTYNPYEPLPNGNGTHTAAFATDQPGRSTTPVFTVNPLSRAFTMPIPGPPGSFGENREFLPLILSKGLIFNRARRPCPPTALAMAVQRLARVPAFPRLRIHDWRLRINSWPKATRDESDVEMDPYITTLRKTMSNTW